MAQTDYARRLEQLMEVRGVETIQDFVDGLNRDSDRESIPYATARRYHRDREPPIGYLVRVAETFGARIEWLATGEGPATDEEADREEVGRAALGRRWSEDLSAALDGAAGVRVPAVAHAVVFHHWRRLQVLASQPEGTRESPEELMERLVHAVVAPLQGQVDVGWLRSEDVADYVMAVAPAVARVLELELMRMVSEGIREG